MVTIRPTAESGLSGSYAIKLPDLDISVDPPRITNTARTISGGVVVSTWPGNIAGEQRSTTRHVTREQYESLRAIMATEESQWLLTIRGRIFKVVFSLDGARPNKQVRDFFDVTLSFVFIEEITT
jgi:hypothetical protein